MCAKGKGRILTGGGVSSVALALKLYSMLQEQALGRANHLLFSSGAI